jgi:hypothetical protein
MLLRNTNGNENTDTREVLYVRPVADGANFMTNIYNRGGDLLLTSVVRPTDQEMIVTDYRNNTVRTLPISISNTLEESAEDMRELGYITENQTLQWAEGFNPADVTGTVDPDAVEWLPEDIKASLRPSEDDYSEDYEDDEDDDWDYYDDDEEIF